MTKQWENEWENKWTSLCERIDSTNDDYSDVLKLLAEYYTTVINSGYYRGSGDKDGLNHSLAKQGNLERKIAQLLSKNGINVVTKYDR